MTSTATSPFVTLGTHMTAEPIKVFKDPAGEGQVPLLWLRYKRGSSRDPGLPYGDPACSLTSLIASHTAPAPRQQPLQKFLVSE